jgi:CRP-like cAMP-binding protein
VQTGRHRSYVQGTIVAPSNNMSPRHRERSLRIVRDGMSGTDPASNWLLASLPPRVFTHLAPHLERVRLDKKQVLFRAHERLGSVYFPATAVVSLVGTLGSGETLEVGLTGRDGVAGAVALPDVCSMPCDGVVQISGIAHRLDAGLFKQALRNYEPLSAAVGRYAYLLLVRSMQMQLCDMFHPVEQRLTRWLLMVSDLVARAEIPLTHEFLATMLGVRRPTVTLVVGSLQRAGLIEVRRGQLTIRDRERLEAACCDCYQLMCEQQDELLGYSCEGVLRSSAG